MHSRSAEATTKAAEMRRTLSSSMMVSVGYDSTCRTLEIEFVGGDVYQYFDVAYDDYYGLVTAPSAGRFFHSHIAPNYRYECVRRARHSRTDDGPVGSCA